ncbi:hypothetical protein FOL47_006832 [Perkinsus chesapeaki]|uniref:Cytochrome P450 n=1 Tax=Perkinsus chesapeaki TaxID=330153 RepID=A0A7J6MYT3_PERCH|nr:hypothetical protein FOL47_006832 [Perkinsus chesapeaki]
MQSYRSLLEASGEKILKTISRLRTKDYIIALTAVIAAKVSFELRYWFLKPPFPGPSFLSLIRASLGGVSSVVDFVDASAREHERVYSIRTPKGPVVVVSDPDLGRSLLKQRPKKFARWKVPRLLNEMNMAIAEGNQWQRLRRHGSAPLNETRVLALISTLCAEADELILKVRRDGEEFMVWSSPEHDIHRLCEFGMSPMKVLYEDRMLSKAVFPPARRLHGDWRYLREIIQEDADMTALASLTTKELTDNVLLFWLAGSETVSVTLAWLLYLLCLNPDIQRQARQEALAARDDLVSAAKTNALPFIEACIHETLRLHSPAPLIPLTAATEAEIEGKLIKPGTLVLVLLAAPMLREGNDFRPERWFTSDGNSIDREKANGHLAFGFGRRRCPGRDLAIKEAMIVTAKLLIAFNNIRLSPNAKVTPVYNTVVTLKPAGLMLEVTPAG